MLWQRAHSPGRANQYRVLELKKEQRGPPAASAFLGRYDGLYQ